jgi:hypothetical protein
MESALESLAAQTESLRVQFLERELELTATMIALVSLEGEHSAHMSQAIRHVCLGLDIVRKFVGQVSSPDERARIADRLERLEAEVATLATDFVRNRTG